WLLYPDPVITSISPNPASANEPITVTGQNFFGPHTELLFPGPNGTQIEAPLATDYITSLTTAVPPGAVSGQVIVRNNPEGTSQSTGVPFTRLPNLRIRAPMKDLSPGETVQFQSQLLGASTPNTVNWTVDVGSISSSGLYQAPSVSQETF